MERPPNPVRLVVYWVGLALVRAGLIDRERARRTTDLAWPRIVTGLARMSKNAIDVAMVGVAIGTSAITGVGFAASFWGIAFALGGGVASGTIALVSQAYGADESGGQAVRSSVVIVLALTIPVAALFWSLPTELVGLLSNDPAVVALGADYLQVVGLGIPFAGLNLIGSRTLVGTDDAWTPMVIRAGGAVVNIALNAVLIFGVGLGVVGAAIGTVLANVVVTTTFALGFTHGRVPLVGSFEVTLDPLGTYVDRDTMRQLVEIGTPMIGKNLAWRLGEFPLLAIVDIFGTAVAAAFVIALRVRDLMNTPGWGFSLASSSLVGQELGIGDEASAEAYGRDVMRFAVVVYFVSAGLVFVFAEPIALAFVGDPTAPALPITVTLIYATCVGIVFRGLSRTASGPLRASGDTRWPFYGQVLGYAIAIPVAYLGAVTPLGLAGLGLAIVIEMVAPAIVNYYRFSTGKWKAISRSYRPAASSGD
ncbi:MULTISPECIES: MATE family efflux transporter [Halococcus]|uniref:MATE family efflux transporter n=1 Tax=Halococcus TaxID=2249 RepID=UPI0006780508|nr:MULTISPECIES: MATE family efflux transporter [Halococcus]